MTTKGELLYSGKAKRLYRTDDEDILWVEYLDQATAFNGEKKDVIDGKGPLNNRITSLIFELLAAHGIESHFVSQLSSTEQLVRAVRIIPLEVVVRNVAAGSISKRLGLAEGTSLPFPVLEFYYKDDELGDPLINEDHIKVLELASPGQLEQLRSQALGINQVLKGVFAQTGIDLIDFKLEFGILPDGKLILADEISPDTCRLWDRTSGNHLDKDVYRRELGSLVPVYQIVLDRLESLSV